VNAKAWLLKVSLVSVVMAFATVFYLQPQAHLDLVTTLGVVALMELIGFVLAGTLAGFGTGGLLLATLFNSLALALVITFVYVPLNNPGFDWLVAGIFFIQLAGTASSLLIVRASKR